MLFLQLIQIQIDGVPLVALLLSDFAVILWLFSVGIEFLPFVVAISQTSLIMSKASEFQFTCSNISLLFFSSLL